MASGALESIVLNGRRFSCANDDSPVIALGGWSNESVVHSDGTFHPKKTRVLGYINSVNIKIDDSREDQEFIQELCAKHEPFTVSATKVDGTVYGGSVIITEQKEVDASTQHMEISMEGNIEKIA